MGFACWGQLGQPYSPTNEAASGAAAVKCDALFRCGSRLEKPSRLGEPKSPGARPASIILVSYMPLAADRVAGENRSLVHPCRRAPLEAKRTGALLQQRLRKRAITLRRGRQAPH